MWTHFLIVSSRVLDRKKKHATEDYGGKLEIPNLLSNIDCAFGGGFSA
jgi:hypothetical protein